MLMTQFICPNPKPQTTDWVYPQVLYYIRIPSHGTELTASYLFPACNPIQSNHIIMYYSASGNEKQAITTNILSIVSSREA